MVDHSQLPSASNAPLPESYTNAKTALSKCTKMDECKDWSDKAEALASYARQANDDQLRKMADRIQARAIRRAGELYNQIEPDKGGYHGNYAQDGTVPSTRKQAATDAGLSERQRKTASRVANIPEDQFEQAVESDDPPTVTQLAEAGKKSRPLVDLKGRDPKAFNRATHFVGLLRRHLEGLQGYDIGAITDDLNDDERKKVRDIIAKIDAIHDQIATRV